MDRENLESLDEESLFKIQNTISEIIRERNFKKGDIEAIVDNAFNVAFPKIDIMEIWRTVINTSVKNNWLSFSGHSNIKQMTFLWDWRQDLDKYPLTA